MSGNDGRSTLNDSLLDPGSSNGFNPVGESHDDPYETDQNHNTLGRSWSEDAAVIDPEGCRTDLSFNEANYWWMKDHADAKHNESGGDEYHSLASGEDEKEQDSPTDEKDPKRSKSPKTRFTRHDAFRDPPEDLDMFFSRVYAYFVGQGLAHIVVEKLMHLLSLAFSILFSTFLVLYVNWADLVDCTSPDSCAKIHPIKTVHFNSLNWFECVVVVYFLLLTIYWFWCLLAYVFTIKQMFYIRDFYVEKLELSDHDLAAMDWPDVVNHILKLQETWRICPTHTLTRSNITNYIMRKDNFFIGMVNEKLLDIPLPSFSCASWKEWYTEKTENAAPKRPKSRSSFVRFDEAANEEFVLDDADDKRSDQDDRRNQRTKLHKDSGRSYGSVVPPPPPPRPSTDEYPAPAALERQLSQDSTAGSEVSSSDSESSGFDEESSLSSTEYSDDSLSENSADAVKRQESWEEHQQSPGQGSVSAGAEQTEASPTYPVIENIRISKYTLFGSTLQWLVRYGLYATLFDGHSRLRTSIHREAYVPTYGSAPIDEGSPMEGVDYTDEKKISTERKGVEMHSMDHTDNGFYQMSGGNDAYADYLGESADHITIDVTAPPSAPPSPPKRIVPNGDMSLTNTPMLSKEQRLVANQLRNRFRLLGVLSLLLMPFLLMFMIIVFFLRYFEEVHNKRTFLGPRQYSNLAKWRLRMFNELPHSFDKRLEKSQKPAHKYLASFQSPVIITIAQCIAFIAGSVVAVLLLLTFLDSSILLNLKMGHRALLWYLAMFSAILGISRSFIPASPPDTSDAASLLRDVAVHTRLMPIHWVGCEASVAVADEFRALYSTRTWLLAEELLSVLGAPLILWFVMPKRCDSIVEYIASCSEYIPGVGDMHSATVEMGQDAFPAPKPADFMHRHSIEDHYSPEQDASFYAQQEALFLNGAIIGYKQYGDQYVPVYATDQSIDGSPYNDSVFGHPQFEIAAVPDDASVEWRGNEAPHTVNPEGTDKPQELLPRLPSMRRAVSTDTVRSQSSVKTGSSVDSDFDGRETISPDKRHLLDLERAPSSDADLSQSSTISGKLTRAASETTGSVAVDNTEAPPGPIVRSISREVEHKDQQHAGQHSSKTSTADGLSLRRSFSSNVQQLRRAPSAPPVPFILRGPDGRMYHLAPVKYVNVSKKRQSQQQLTLGRSMTDHRGIVGRPNNKPRLIKSIHRQGTSGRVSLTFKSPSPQKQDRATDKPQRTSAVRHDTMGSPTTLPPMVAAPEFLTEFDIHRLTRSGSAHSTGNQSLDSGTGEIERPFAITSPAVVHERGRHSGSHPHALPQFVAPPGSRSPAAHPVYSTQSGRFRGPPVRTYDPDKVQKSRENFMQQFDGHYTPQRSRKLIFPRMHSEPNAPRPAGNWQGPARVPSAGGPWVRTMSGLTLQRSFTMQSHNSRGSQGSIHRNYPALSRASTRERRSGLRAHYRVSRSASRVQQQSASPPNNVGAQSGSRNDRRHDSEVSMTPALGVEYPRTPPIVTATDTAEGSELFNMVSPHAPSRAGGKTWGFPFGQASGSNATSRRESRSSSVEAPSVGSVSPGDSTAHPARLPSSLSDHSFAVASPYPERRLFSSSSHEFGSHLPPQGSNLPAAAHDDEDLLAQPTFGGRLLRSTHSADTLSDEPSSGSMEYESMNQPTPEPGSPELDDEVGIDNAWVVQSPPTQPPPR